MIRGSRYAASLLARDPFSAYWLGDLRHHAALALIMARAAAPAMVPDGLTRRRVSDLTRLSASTVHALIADACDNGYFERDADAGDRRRVLLRPSPATERGFASLVQACLLLVGDDDARAAAAACDAQVRSTYAQFACALVTARRPGGRLWVEPQALAMLSDLMVAGRRGARTAALKAAAMRRGQHGKVDGDLGLAAMAGLIEAVGDRVRLTPEGRDCLHEHLEIWRLWSSEARLALAQCALPPAAARAA